METQFIFLFRYIPFGIKRLLCIFYLPSSSFLLLVWLGLLGLHSLLYNHVWSVAESSYLWMTCFHFVPCCFSVFHFECLAVLLKLVKGTGKIVASFNENSALCGWNDLVTIGSSSQNYFATIYFFLNSSVTRGRARGCVNFRLKAQFRNWKQLNPKL